MKRRLIAMFLSICLVFSLIPVSVQAASKPNIKIGDYVKMGTYNGNSILWRCVSIDADGPLMLADKIVDTLAYDAKTNDNSNSKSHSREAISVMITVLTIGGTVICVPGLIQQQRLAKQSLCRLCSK